MYLITSPGHVTGFELVNWRGSIEPDKRVIRDSGKTLPWRDESEYIYNWVMETGRDKIWE